MGTKNIPCPRLLNSGLFGSRERERVDASPQQRPLNSGLFGSRERQRVDASPHQRPLNSGLFGSRERQRVDASPQQRPLNSGLFGSRERQRVDASPQQRPLNSGLFGSRERQRVDASALAGARGYLQITVRNYRAIAITTRWRSRLRGQSKSEAFGRFELFECLIAGSYEHARAEFRLPRIVHTPLDAMQFTAGTEPSPPG